MNEAPIMQRIRVALSRGDGRIFRNNQGQTWTGRVISNNMGRVVLEDARPFHAGLAKGSADLIGWQSITIAPDMVGRKLAVFTSVEVKGPKGRVTELQDNWARAVKEAGGFAGIARSVEDAEKLISLPTNNTEENGLNQ